MEYEVLIPDSVDWITDGGNTRAVTTHSHMLTIAANSSYDARQTEVVFLSLIHIYIGTELNNKAETVLLVEKDKNDSDISRVSAMHIRAMDFEPFRCV